LCYERLGRQYAIADHCAQVANMGIFRTEGLGFAVSHAGLA